MGLTLSGVEGLAASGLTFSLLGVLGFLVLAYFLWRLQQSVDQLFAGQTEMYKKLVSLETFEDSQVAVEKKIDGIKEAGDAKILELNEELKQQNSEKEKLDQKFQELLDKLKALEKGQKELLKKQQRLESENKRLETENKEIKKQLETSNTEKNQKFGPSEPKPVTHTTTPITIHKYVNPHPPPWEMEGKVASASGPSPIGFSSGRESVSSNGATSPDVGSSMDSHNVLQLPLKSIMFNSEFLPSEAILPQDEAIVSADIGFRSPDEYKPADIREPRPHSLWSSPGSAKSGVVRAVSGGSDAKLRPVPLLPLEKLNNDEGVKSKRRSTSVLDGGGADKSASKSPDEASPDSRQDTVRSPHADEKAALKSPSSAKSGDENTSGSARTPKETPKGVYSYNTSFGLLKDGSARSRKSSPNLSSSSSPASTKSTKSRRSYGSSAPLSARGINPDKHPELHAREMKEMTRLVDKNCRDSAEVVSRTEILCLWCKNTFKCPPYRPQSFYFKDTQNAGEHDGHFWTCEVNPNVSLQAGQCVPIGDGKVLI